MGIILRTTEKRKKTQRYICNDKRVKVDMMKPQKPTTKIVGTQKPVSSKSDKEGNSKKRDVATGLKKNSEALQLENDTLKKTVESLNQSIQLLKASVESLGESNEELRQANTTMIDMIVQMKTDLKALKVENEYLKSLATDEDSAAGEAFPVTETTETSSINWLKVCSPAHYLACCKNLKQKPSKAAELVRYIGENIFEDKVTNYVFAAAVLLFEPKFFIQQVSFKHEEGRVCVKDTKIIKCIGESIIKKFNNEADFPEDVDGFIQKTFSTFKKKITRSPEIWNEFLN